MNASITEMIASEQRVKYFDRLYAQDFDLEDLAEDSSNNNELDYLSDNEIQHHINDGSVYSMIKRTNLIYYKFRKLRMSLMVIQKVIGENLKKIKKKIRFNKNRKLLSKVTSMIALNSTMISKTVKSQIENEQQPSIIGMN